VFGCAAHLEAVQIDSSANLNKVLPPLQDNEAGESHVQVSMLKALMLQSNFYKRDFCCQPTKAR
jgi:hypothetical protein